MLNPDVTGGRESYAVPIYWDSIANGIQFPPDGGQTIVPSTSLKADNTSHNDRCLLHATLRVPKYRKLDAKTWHLQWREDLIVL